jgi:digeranylgeranylglycerophospholipid reductase
MISPEPETPCDYDVVVVGAGPAGTAAARFSAEQGLSVLCIEEHGTIGHPVQCAGLLSLNAFRECRVPDHSILNRVKGAEIITGSGSRLLIDAGMTKAFVVDRGVLDRGMAEAAAGAGALFRLKTAVYRVHDNRVVTRGVHGHEEFGCKVLIAADGPRSTIARLQGMKRAPSYLSGIQAEIACRNAPEYVGIYPDASPEFFAWRIPVSNGRARIGLAGMTNVKEHFSRFRSSFPGASLDFVTGTIPIGVMPVTYGHRTLYVGDAAGFAKPTSGGGVYTGIRSARHAADTAVKCIESGRYNDQALARYEQLWKQDIGGELSLGLKMFRFRQGLGPSETDRLIRALSDPEIIAIIREHGDMDRPAKVVVELLKKPALYSLSLMMIRCGYRMISGDILN